MFERVEQDAALITLVAFHCFLRTGEMLSLSFDSITVDVETGTGVINLGNTKESRRQSLADASVRLESAAGSSNAS